MTEWTAIALYDFQSANDVELELKKGDLVKIRRTSVGDGWWEGEKGAKRGLVPMKFVRKISEVYSDSDERGVSMSKSASPVISGTASSEDLLQEQGEDQEYTESVAKETAHISSSHPISSSLVVKTLTESSTSKAATPTLSRRALMDSLLTPDTKTTYDKVKAKDLFGDNAPVRILGGPKWEVRKSWKRILVKLVDKQQNTAARTLYEIETKSIEATVTRKYKDFLSLYDKLAELFPCVCLPPLPVKQLSGLLEASFIESRRRSLERFINRVANHPVLSCTKTLHEFLTKTDLKEWKIGSRSTLFSLNRSALKKIFGPSVYSAVEYSPHNYQVSQLPTVETFSHFTRLIDVNLTTIQQSCCELATKTGDMASTVQAVGKDLIRFAHGEEPPVQLTVQQKKSSTNSMVFSAIYRTASELEESGPRANDTDWGWHQKDTDFMKLVGDLVAVGEGIEKTARQFSLQQDILEQSTIDVLQDYSGTLHKIPGIVKLHEDAMKAYQHSKERDSKKEAEVMKQYTEAINNIVLAEFNYLHGRLITDFRDMFGEFLSKQADFHSSMAKKWSELHKQFTHTTNSQAEAPHYVNFDMSTQTPILHGSNLKQYQKRTNEGGGTSSLPNLLDSVDCISDKRLRDLAADSRVDRLSAPSTQYNGATFRHSSEGEYDVYVPFEPGKPPSVGVKGFASAQGNSPPNRRKAADYLPFVPLGESKSDPNILDDSHAKKQAQGYLSFVPLNQQTGEDFQVRPQSSIEDQPRKKAMDYLQFVPINQQQKTLEEQHKQSDNDSQSGSGGMQASSKESSHTKGSPEASSERSPVNSRLVESDPDQTLTPDSPSVNVVQPARKESLDIEVTRTQSMDCSDCVEDIDILPKTASLTKHSYTRRKFEAGDSSSSSGESSPSPCVRSITSETLSNGSSWNNDSTKRSTTCSITDHSSSLNPPTSTSSWNEGHSPLTDKSASWTERESQIADKSVDSGVHSTTAQESDTSWTSGSRRKTSVSELIRKYQSKPNNNESNAAQEKEMRSAQRRRKSAADRYSSSSTTSNKSSSSVRSHKSTSSLQTRKGDQKDLKSMGIIEDKDGGSFDV